jgi:hypothetical protein
VGTLMLSDALLATMHKTATKPGTDAERLGVKHFAAWVLMLVAEVRRLRSDNEELCIDSAAEHRCLKSICGLLVDAGCSTGEFHELAAPVREVVDKLAEARKLLESAAGQVHKTDLMRAIEAFLGMPRGAGDDS